VRREVFLTNITDECGIESLYKPAMVLTLQKFRDVNKSVVEARQRANVLAAVKAARGGSGDEAMGGGGGREGSVDVQDAGGSPTSASLLSPTGAAAAAAAAVANSAAAGEDVFLCEYTYDAHFKSFKRRHEWEPDDFSDDEVRPRCE
jgi:hypothetical protein